MKQSMEMKGNTNGKYTSRDIERQRKDRGSDGFQEKSNPSPREEAHTESFCACRIRNASNGATVS